MGDSKETEETSGSIEGGGKENNCDLSDVSDNIDEKDGKYESVKEIMGDSKETGETGEAGEAGGSYEGGGEENNFDSSDVSEEENIQHQPKSAVPESGHRKPEPQPTDPQPSNPKSTEHQPTEPQPTEHQPTEHQPTEHQPTEHQPTETRPLKSEVTEAQPSKPIILWCFSLISFTLVTFLISYFFVSSVDPIHNYNDPNTFIQKLEKVQKDFPNQNAIIWNMLKNGGRRHLNKVQTGKEKSTPQSYLIAGYSGSSDTVECFVLKLAESFTKHADLRQSTVNSETFNQDKDVGNLFTELNLRLNTNEKLVIVTDIDKLPYSVASLFMSFTDEHNTVATHPQSLLFLTTVLPFSFDSSQSRLEDEGRAAEHFKSNIWGDVPSYKKDPLWSRVGDGIILIKKEEVNPCKVVKDDL